MRVAQQVAAALRPCRQRTQHAQQLLTWLPAKPCHPASPLTPAGWPVASELIHRKLQYNVLPALQPGSRFNRRARQQAREDAHQLLDQARQCLRASRSWLPAAFQQPLEARQQEWAAKLAASEGGGSAAAPKPQCECP